MKVYAEFGIAMYNAQCLEREFAISLARVYYSGPNRITWAQFLNFLDSNYKKTLGKLIFEMRKTTSIPSDMESTLMEALKKRNWLVHDYFWDRAGHFLTAEGRELMINELRDTTNFLSQIDEELTVVNRAWATSKGVTEEMRRESLEDLIRSAGA
jgi:hypothetical protein